MISSVCIFYNNHLLPRLLKTILLKLHTKYFKHEYTEYLESIRYQNVLYNINLVRILQQTLVIEL